MLSHSLPPSPSGRDTYRHAMMGGGGSPPIRALQQQHQSRIPAGLHHRGPGHQGSPPHGSTIPLPAGPSRIGSPAGSASPPLGPSPTNRPSPRMSPSPRVVREQWAVAASGDGSSPYGGGGVSGRGGSRSARHMMPLVSQSLDGGLLQAGAAREQQGQVGALQQVRRGVLSNAEWCLCVLCKGRGKACERC